jgi:oligoribonuclease (3'-5' exoribonuclease)
MKSRHEIFIERDEEKRERTDVCVETHEEEKGKLEVVLNNKHNKTALEQVIMDYVTEEDIKKKSPYGEVGERVLNTDIPNLNARLLPLLCDVYAAGLNGNKISIKLNYGVDYKQEKETN